MLMGTPLLHSIPDALHRRSHSLRAVSKTIVACGNPSRPHLFKYAFQAAQPPNISNISSRSLEVLNRLGMVTPCLTQGLRSPWVELNSMSILMMWQAAYLTLRSTRLQHFRCGIASSMSPRPVAFAHSIGAILYSIKFNSSSRGSRGAERRSAIFNDQIFFCSDHDF